MYKFKKVKEIFDLAQEKGLKKGFYKKGTRIQWLFGFDAFGYMQVTTPAQIKKGRFGKPYSATAWNLLDECNFKKLEWFLKADYIGVDIEGVHK